MESDDVLVICMLYLYFACGRQSDSDFVNATLNVQSRTYVAKTLYVFESPTGTHQPQRAYEPSDLLSIYKKIDGFPEHIV